VNIVNFLYFIRSRYLLTIKPVYRVFIPRISVNSWNRSTSDVSDSSMHQSCNMRSVGMAR